MASVNVKFTDELLRTESAVEAVKKYARKRNFVRALVKCFAKSRLVKPSIQIPTDLKVQGPEFRAAY